MYIWSDPQSMFNDDGNIHRGIQENTTVLSGAWQTDYDCTDYSQYACIIMQGHFSMHVPSKSENDH